MSLFPWDDWFYHVSEKEQELQQCYQTYVDQKAAILVHGQSYQRYLSDYQNILVKNYALLIVAQIATMTEDDFSAWLKQIGDQKPPQKYDATVFQVISGTADLIGLLALGKVIFNAGSAAVKALAQRISAQAAEDGALDGMSDMSESLLSDSISSMSEEMSDAGLSEEGSDAISSIADLSSDTASLGTDAGIEAAGEAVGEASAASLGAVATGGAIFVAVGLDCIMGAIQGSEESQKIEAEKSRIQAALNVVNSYLSRLDAESDSLIASTQKQMQLFQANLAILNKIIPLGLSVSGIDPTIGNLSAYKPVIDLAVSKYGFLSQIRTDWQNFCVRHPTAPKWDVFADEMEDFAPSSLTNDQVAAFLAYAQGKVTASAQPAPAAAAAAGKA